MKKTVVLLATALTLTSAGAALGGDKPQSKLPVVINNVHVPIGDLQISYGPGQPPSDLGVCCSPNGVVVNPVTNRIYSVEASGGGAFTPATGWSVSVIDGKAANGNLNQIIKNIPVSTDPSIGGQFMAVNTKTDKIYVGLSQFANDPPPGYVAVIDGKTNKVIKNITGFGPGGPQLAVNNVTNKIYVTDYNNTLWVIDGNKDTIVNSIANVGANELAVSEKHNKIFLANYDVGTISVVDGATNKILTTNVQLSNCVYNPTTYPDSCNPIQLAVNDRTGKVYIVREDHNLSVLDAKTNQEIAVISLANPLEAASFLHEYGIDIDQETNIIYVGHYSGFVDVVDGDTNSLIGTVTEGLPLLNNPFGITLQPGMVSVDSQHHRLYVATGQSGAVAVLQTFGGDGGQQGQESIAAGP